MSDQVKVWLMILLDIILFYVHGSILTLMFLLSVLAPFVFQQFGNLWRNVIQKMDEKRSRAAPPLNLKEYSPWLFHFQSSHYTHTLEIPGKLILLIVRSYLLFIFLVVLQSYFRWKWVENLKSSDEWLLLKSFLELYDTDFFFPVFFHFANFSYGPIFWQTPDRWRRLNVISNLYKTIIEMFL